LSDNKEFIDLLKSGDSKAFAELVEQYQHIVFNTVLTIVQQFQDAEDLTQEVFAQVYKSIAHFRGDSKLSTWIYRIALTKSLELERKRKAKRTIGFFKNLIGLEQANLNVKEFHHPGILMQQKENATMLFKALQSLPKNQRIAFILIKAEGLSYQEVSAIMNKSIKSLEGLIHRAGENLRLQLKSYYNEN